MTKYKKPDYARIADRIRLYREKLQLTDESGRHIKPTQENLLAYMKEQGLHSFGRNTLSKLENGDETAFSAVTLMQWNDLCSVFGCSIGHLLGEYECHDFDTQFIKNETGLSEKSISIIQKLRRNNQIEWGLDTLNLMLENPLIEEFLYYLTSFSISGEEMVDAHPFRIKQKDIFQMNMNTCLKEIADNMIESNKEKPDYRGLYQRYLDCYLNPRPNDGYLCSLDKIQKDMENNGLTFDPKLFEGRERNG